VDDVDAGEALEQLALPTPGEAYDSFPGSRFASANSSVMVFAGTSLLTARMLDITRTRAMGARSRAGSKVGLGCKVGLIVIAPLAPQ
jgi:hypothetical protein